MKREYSQVYSTVLVRVHLRGCAGQRIPTMMHYMPYGGCAFFFYGSAQSDLVNIYMQVLEELQLTSFKYPTDIFVGARNIISKLSRTLLTVYEFQ